MVRLRPGVMLIALAGSGLALAQPAPPAPAPAGPLDPYATPQGKDPVISEQIAEQLVERAQDLYDAKLYVDAKQLAVEALVERNTGNAADRARYLVKLANQQLGITDDSAAPPPPVPPPQPPVVDTRPIEDPTAHPLPPIAAPVDTGAGHLDPKLLAMGYGGFYGAVVGGAIGTSIASDHEAAAGIPTALAFGAGGLLLAPYLVRHWDIDDVQVRTAGSGMFWTSVAGGMFGYTVQGANGGTARGYGVMLGAGIGGTVGLLGGGVYAKQHKLTRGDVALVDTFAGMGAAGGLTIGMLMQPAQKQAYSLNSVVGIGAGVVVGMIAAPQTNTTPRRMLRVAGLAAAGGAAPLLLLAAGPNDSGLQRAAGGLSSLGLVAGAWLGFYLTRHMDEGLDVPDKQIDTHDSPVNPPPPPAMTNTQGPGMTFVMPLAAGRF